jgi:hypothetical protein
MEKRSKDWAIVVLVLVVYYLQRAITFRHGLNYEEGRDAGAYLLFLGGLLPYRDFEWIYGPFSFAVYPLVMKLFGVNLVVLRAAYLAFASLIIPLSFFLARRIMPGAWAAAAAFLSVLYITTPYYTYNHVFAVLGELLSLLMFCRIIEASRPLPYLILLGLSSSLVMLTKHFLTGISLFACISLCLLLFGGRSIREKLKNISIFYATELAALAAVYSFLWFSAHTTKACPAHYVINRDSMFFIDQARRANPIFMAGIFLDKINNILPLLHLCQLSSWGQIKQLMAVFYDTSIYIFSLSLPLIALAGCLFLRRRQQAKAWLTPRIRYIILYSLFSLFIIAESAMIHHFHSRAFNTQLTFILSLFILYAASLAFPQRRKIFYSALFILLFYLAFLPFFRYPCTMLRNYNQRLRLERGGGIFLNRQDRSFYESLSEYLSARVKGTGAIAVLGYYPQIAFLSGQRDIFARDEFIFQKFKYLRYLEHRGPAAELMAVNIEDEIMRRISNEKPSVILIVSNNAFGAFRLRHPRVYSFLQGGYRLDRGFGPVDIYGSGDEPEQVEAYLYNGRSLRR